MILHMSGPLRNLTTREVKMAILQVVLPKGIGGGASPGASVKGGLCRQN